MKRIRSKTLWLLALLCITVSRPTIAEPVDSAGTTVKDLAQSYNDFAFALLARVTKEHTNQNVFISPTSAALALAMTREGAKGQTERELNNVLHCNQFASNDFARANSELLKILTQPNPSAKLEIANSIWASLDAAIKPAFVTQLNQAFGASALNVNLTDPLTVLKMNQWVRSETHGKISQIADAPFDDLTKMVLLDAVYFKGTWERTFDSTLTKTSQFFSTPKNAVDRSFMVQTGGFEYAERDSIQAVFLPYIARKFGMYVMLPSKFGSSPGSILFPDGHEVFATTTNYDAASRFAQFFSGLNAQTWNEWTAALRYRDGTLELPKFKLNLAFNLKKPLAELGMRSAFSTNADFSGISDERPYVGACEQKTFVEVNEEGTEAAAVTSVEISNGLGISERFRMVVDSPFFVAIVDQQTQAIVFMGVIYDPS